MNKEILTGEVGNEIKLQSIENKSKIVINSFGGSLYEGLAMYDYIKGSAIEVGVIGVCASAATLLVLASRNSWATENSRFLIHNPSQLTSGNAKDLEKVTNELLFEQERALQLYVDNLTIGKEEIIAKMESEEIFDAKEALRIGLINEIQSFNEKPERVEGSDIKAIYNKFKMFNDMEKNKDLEKEMSFIRAGIDKILNFFNKKMLVVQDTNGAEINFGEEIQDLSQVSEGLTGVTVDGATANGTYMLNSGESFTFDAGTVTEIAMTESEESEVEALRAENEALKAEISEVQNSLKSEKEKTMKIETEVKALKNKFETFRASFKPEKPTENQPEEVEKPKSGFSWKK